MSESRAVATLRGLRDRLGRAHTRWIVLGLVVGLVSGLAAGAFYLALDFATDFLLIRVANFAPPRPWGEGEAHFAPSGDPRLWLLVVLPALGGLVSGLISWKWAPEVAGAGTDEMIRVFHFGRGIVRKRAPLAKALATIATLASGGSAGKEGPVAQICGGLGSLVAGAFELNVRDRRVLLLAGTAGGLGAIFGAPVGSAIIAIEMLYREDFEADALIPCVISAVTAYMLFTFIAGTSRIFAVPEFSGVHPTALPGFLLLAFLCVPLGRAYIGLYRFTRMRIFARLPLATPLKPALGGLGVGALGFFVPGVLGTGWGYLQIALDGKLRVRDAALLLVANSVATFLTVGSGGSGGVFGPTLLVGGLLGTVVGFGGAGLAPELFPQPAAYVLVGMAGFFAGVASAPIGAMFMVAEMTGGYELLPPLMLVSVLAILFGRGRSIYAHQLKDRFASPAHLGDLTVNVLEEMRVGDIYRPLTSVASVTPATRFERLRELLLESEEATLPVLDAEHRLVGLVTAEQLRPVMDDRQLDAFVLAGDIAVPPVALLPDDDLYRAHQLFRSCGCPQIPVLAGEDGAEPLRIVGMLDYREMMRAYERELVRRRES